MTMEQVRVQAQRQGKQFISYLQFIEAVRKGEHAIVVGPDYVVLSKAKYEELTTTTGALPESPSRQSGSEER